MKKYIFIILGLVLVSSIAYARSEDWFKYQSNVVEIFPYVQFDNSVDFQNHLISNAKIMDTTIYLRSPNKSLFILTVSNRGVLSITPAP